MQKAFAAILSLLVLTLTVQAQQPAQYTLYMLDAFRYNPAYAGLDDALVATGAYRQQWAGLSGAPVGYVATVQLPLYMLRGGVGLQLESDALGARRSTSARLAYNYQVPLANGVLSLGLAAGTQQWTLSGEDLRTPDGVYNEPGNQTHNDDLLSLNTEQGRTLLLSSGLFFKNDRLSMGLAVENLHQPTILLTALNYQLRRTYFAYAATQHVIGQSLVLQPSIWFRNDATESQLDLSLMATYNDNISIGASFRGYNANTRDAVALMGAFNLTQQLRLAYAYDIGLSALKTAHDGSHEIVVQYRLNKAIGAGKPPRIIYHPRAKS